MRQKREFLCAKIVISHLFLNCVSERERERERERDVVSDSHDRGPLLHQLTNKVSSLKKTTEYHTDLMTQVTIDLIHDSRHVGFAIIMQISYALLRGQTTKVREVITNILATQMICFMFIECLSPK